MAPTERNATYRLVLLSLLILSGVFKMHAGIPVSYEASVTAQSSSLSLAPYMLGSWNEGKYMEGNGIWQGASLLKEIDRSKRFDWSAGAGYLAGVGQNTYYARWNDVSESWSENSAGRNAFRITRLFGQLKFRGAFIMAGMRNTRSGIVDEDLSSGDLTRSNNATPIPGVAIGFIDFQDIPFTKGWVQINGELMYGRMMDTHFKQREFNRYSGVEALNLYYNYKYCYFRTNPNKNFHVTVGMQAAAMFGGTTYNYGRGRLVSTERRGFHFKDLLQAFFPREGGEAYYEGSHLGSWDLKATYRFSEGSSLHAYFEWPWEDGSGIGKMNGWDGLWGIQYDFADRGVITKAVVEYLDFTNQAGPIHYAPDDNPESNMTGHASGSDDYYNNGFYGAYTNYGMGIGTPFLVAPIYNRDGMLSYLHNRARGFHAAVEGHPTACIYYRGKVGYSVAGGSGWVPSYRKLHSTSAMIEGRMQPLRKIPEFEVGLKIAFDKGSLRGDNFGAQIQVSYKGSLSLK